MVKLWIFPSDTNNVEQQNYTQNKKFSAVDKAFGDAAASLNVQASGETTTFDPVCRQRLIRAVWMKDGDAYPPRWMVQKLGEIGKTRIVSSSDCLHRVILIRWFYCL